MRKALAVACVLLIGPSLLLAENRFFFDDTVLPEGGADEALVLKADTDVDILAFQVGLLYDTGAITFTGATLEGTVVESVSRDGFFDGRIDTENGIVAYGCILWLEPPFDTVIPAGTGQPFIRFIVDVVGDGGTVSELRLRDLPNHPFDPEGRVTIQNRIVKEDLTTVQVGLEVTEPGGQAAGNVIIEDRTPLVSSLEANEGQAGDTFTVRGTFFGEPELTVTVCSRLAEVTLLADDGAILVTAPPCGSSGYALVEVCTIRGCQRVTEGFRYTLAERDFIRGDSNGDQGVDISDGISTLAFLFTGDFTPDCLDALDADDSGAVNISDPIYVFSFLFLGGPEPPSPFPLADVDLTPDELGPCL